MSLQESTVQENTIKKFMTEVKTSQTIWALQSPETEDWVVLDSSHFENTDVMPLWSLESLAMVHCVDEWSDYKPAKISVAEWMEFWIEDLNEDGVIVGIDWLEDECVEIELSDFTHNLSQVEQYK